MNEARHAVTATPRGDYTPDADLLVLMGRWRRVGWLAISVSIALVLAAVMAGSLAIVHQQDRLNAAQRRIEASCSWWHDVGSGDFLGRVPDRSERALMIIVADSRTAFVGQGCPGALPVSLKLAQWASYFQLKITP